MTMSLLGDAAASKDSASTSQNDTSTSKGDTEAWKDNAGASEGDAGVASGDVRAAKGHMPVVEVQWVSVTGQRMSSTSLVGPEESYADGGNYRVESVVKAPLDLGSNLRFVVFLGCGGYTGPVSFTDIEIEDLGR